MKAATMLVLFALTVVVAAQELSPPPGTQILVKVEEDVRLDRVQPGTLLRFTKVSGADPAPNVALPRGAKLYAEVVVRQQTGKSRDRAFVIRLVRGEWEGTVVQLKGELMHLHSNRTRPLTVWSESCDQPGETPQRVALCRGGGAKPLETDVHVDDSGLPTDTRLLDGALVSGRRSIRLERGILLGFRLR